MPVLKLSSTFTAERRAELVRRLADELDQTSHAGEPLIVENPLAPTDKDLVVAVWSEWENIPWIERPRVVEDAYREFDHRKGTTSTRSQSLGVAVGLTWSEADANAFFKYKIEPNVRAGELDEDQIRSAMLEEGAFLAVDRPLLRYMVRPEAERVYRRLQNKLPLAHWNLAELHRTTN